MSDIFFDNIETEIMTKILHDNATDHVILMNQYDNRTETIREVNPCGWYTHFIINDDIKRIEETKLLHIGNAVLPVIGMEYGISFVLHVENGQIDTLEAYTFEENLPNNFVTNYS